MGRIGNPDFFFIVVCDCHVLFELSEEKKKHFYGFWVLYISLRTKVTFSLFLSLSLQLQFSFKWDLQFSVLELKTLQNCSLWFQNGGKTYPMLATKLRRVCHIYIFFINEHHLNPNVSINIDNSKSKLHQCLYRHTLKVTLNLCNCLNLLKLSGCTAL